MIIKKNKNVKIGLLGASFDTGNLGVSALAESSIKVILHRWPEVEFLLFASGYDPKREQRNIAGKTITITSVPVSFSKNIFLPYHFIWMFCLALLVKLAPGRRFKKVIASKNQYFKQLYEIEFAADITGGDSFSDIYGFKRFFLGFVIKWLVVFLGKDLVLLPQTYGPFKKSISKKMAAYILRRAKTVYSRDAKGVECAKNMLRGEDTDKVKLCPDVAFILDAVKPVNMDLLGLKEVRTEVTIVVGFNISGLLYYGGYTRDNMFDLKVDYRELIGNIIELFLSYNNTIILLIPNVFPPEYNEVESDLIVCQKVYDKFKNKHTERLFLAQGVYDHREIKYIIGLCDFFLGSRMHSCIAAMSQCIPSLGLAYSDKFKGVFDTVDSSQFVADMRCYSTVDILDILSKAYNERLVTAKYLEEIIPSVRRAVLNVFNG